MTFSRVIGNVCKPIILWIVRGLALSRIHPNVLTFLGTMLVINIGAAASCWRWGSSDGQALSSSARDCLTWWMAEWLAKPIA